jgi:hypothetical protein
MEVAEIVWAISFYVLALVLHNTGRDLKIKATRLLFSNQHVVIVHSIGKSEA